MPSTNVGDEPTACLQVRSALLGKAVADGHDDDAGWATVGSRLDDQPRLTFQRVPDPLIAAAALHLSLVQPHFGQLEYSTIRS
jgi:hypothetical protein